MMTTGKPARMAMVLSVLMFVAAPAPARAQLAGKWRGQDGNDLVGSGGATRGNDYQDVHVKVTGLPHRREVVYAKLEGLGGDEWQYKGPPSSWALTLVRKPGSGAADLYFEPCRRETGRGFSLKLRFDDGSTAECWIQGGKADPDLRTAAAALKVAWAGQDGHDHVGTGPAVGPDGLQDVHLVVEHLSPTAVVRSIAIEAPGGASWEGGVNPKGRDTAELIRRPDAPGKADLFLAADRDRKGQTFAVTVAYADGKADRAGVVAGRVDPGLGMPRANLPTFAAGGIRARWLGQEAQAPGDVRVALEGLPEGRPVAAAALGDAVAGSWAFRVDDRVPFEAEPFCRPLALRRAGDGGAAELVFPPSRDESGATMTLRLVFRDGRTTIVRFPGGACDPGRVGPGIAPTSAEAGPGDDLNDLAARFGTVRLKRGDHRLTRPLVLGKPVAIVGEPGARLVFAQGGGEPPWSAAIKIHAGPVTLDGFAVRFAGPVRWDQGVDYGPAVIGSADHRDHAPPDPRAGLVISRMDLEGPPASAPSEVAPNLIRMTTASNGRIERNTLKGGAIELVGGPWRVVENDYRGTVPGTEAFSVISTHRTHDLVVRKNRARPVAPCGKTWRFLVMTVGGSGDVVEGNTVEEIGPRDGDTGPNRNAPEIVLTESYRLLFEGKPAGWSADGRVVVVPAPQGGPATSGDVVAVLSGPLAGRWSRIAQAIDGRTYLLDTPLPAGDGAVAIATGFVEETYRGNTIDVRGGAVAAPMVLVGNHFGMKVLDNRLVGSGFRITAAPTEMPGPWGWSHAPMLGARIEGNRVEDAVQGSVLAVEHGETVKSTRGRTYLTASLKDNTFRWTAASLARRRPDAPAALTLGDPGALDPSELIASEQGTKAVVPPGSPTVEPLRILAGRVNGRPILGGRAIASRPEEGPGPRR